jgi:hypothetical protein
MLRLLIVALPLVVALPAALIDEQESNAVQLEVQSPLQFEVRSPPSPALFPQPRHARSTQQPRHTLHTPHEQHPRAHITMHAPRH